MKRADGFFEAVQRRMQAMPHDFVNQIPSAQNVVDIFKGEWSTRMPANAGLLEEEGKATLFNDPRIHWFVEGCNVFGKDVLELGPLEGGHSYMLERYGARSITAIEANSRAFLKCLCVKEIFGLQKVHFLLGNFMRFLESADRRYDVIIASGVLYHLPEPHKLLERLCGLVDNFYIWTHYYDLDPISRLGQQDLFSPPQPFEYDSFTFLSSKRLYPEAALSWQGFSGGLDAYACWLSQESIIGYIESKGFHTSLGFQHLDHPNGPALCIAARRGS